MPRYELALILKAMQRTDHRAAMRDTLQGKLAAGEPRTEGEGGGIPVLFLLLLDCCELGHPSSTKQLCNWDWSISQKMRKHINILLAAYSSPPTSPVHILCRRKNVICLQLQRKGFLAEEWSCL
ncbi:28S ribosomal protein S6, mitochondrial isoform X1 [Aquila chrysaetos chrysaetos]|uniref:28S ribosomal protein S6, mitochondrial isoform X1 n=1 Tax=Aquila chrysaetos chrysaetos TaxID=223781 RepID=UPI001B7D37A0|nr:28S ribosomal protein S6, mitochondrial isoform X1 [Aquila chrysaetos chrysaetos]